MARCVILCLRVIPIAVLVASLGGCGGKPQYEVSGIVKYNGTPLNKPDGKIIFVDSGGVQVEAAIGMDGSYKAKVPAGLNRVVVYYPNPSFTKVSRPSGAPKPKDRPAQASPYLTPEAFANLETSKLEVQVGEGTVYNPELTGPAIP